MATNPVYSKLLGSANVLTPTNTWVTIGTVPAGFRWIVRHVSVINRQNGPYGCFGVLVGDELERPLFGVTGPLVQAQVWYGGTVHEAVMEGGSLQAFSLDPQWQVRVSGFELTLP